MTFLAIDVGNTRLKWALYDAAHPGATLLAHGAEFLEHIVDRADVEFFGTGQAIAVVDGLAVFLAGNKHHRGAFFTT